MPRSTIANRRAIIFDKELELRDHNAPPLSTSTTEIAIAIPATKFLAYKAVVDVAAYTGYVAGTNEWAIALEAATDVNGPYKEVGKLTPSSSQKRFEVPLSGEWVEDIVENAMYIRVKSTKIGTPGNLTYGAFLC